MTSEFSPYEFVTVPDGWTCKSLSDCTEDKNIPYGIVQPGEHVSDGVPVIRINNIKDQQLDLTDVLKVSPEIENKFKRTRLVGGEVLLTLVGSTGQSFVAPDELRGWNVPRAIAVIRATKEVGAEWINLCLQSKEAKHFLDVRANTTVQKTLNLKDVRDIPILIPPKNVKNSIEKIALSLSNKIRINRQTNQTLEQIAQAIFKSWFVDFDPVKVKIAILEAGGTQDAAELAAMSVISGKNEAQLAQLKVQDADAYQQLAQAAALFPPAMRESELGDIPEGWGISEIGDEVDIVGGGTPPTSEAAYWDNGTFHWTTPKDLSNNKSKVLLKTERKVTELGVRKISSGLLPKNTVLMSSRAPVGYLALSKIPVAINQGYIAMKCTKSLSPEFVILWANSVMDEIHQRASGTTFAEISKKNFRTIKVAKPKIEITNLFAEKAKSLFNAIASNECQSENLSELRNSLLPKLLSGQIDISRE